MSTTVLSIYAMLALFALNLLTCLWNNVRDVFGAVVTSVHTLSFRTFSYQGKFFCDRNNTNVLRWTQDRSTRNKSFTIYRVVLRNDTTDNSMCRRFSLSVEIDVEGSCGTKIKRRNDIEQNVRLVEV